MGKPTEVFFPFHFLPLNKPSGPSSHDMVAAVRRLLPSGVKAGHGGTLDPFASGLLLLGIGKATRFFDQVHTWPKSYRAILRLGQETDTLDPQGQVVKQAPVPDFAAKELEEAAAHFTGTILQVPPAYSAKRIAGRRAYQLARRNESPALPAQAVVVHRLELARLDENQLEMRLSCSTGTYVRSLARDLALHLGTVGHLRSLERTTIGPFALEQAIVPPLEPGSLNSFLIPVQQAFAEYPTLSLPPACIEDLYHGRSIPAEPGWPEKFFAQEAPGGKETPFFCRKEADRVRVLFRCF